MNPIASNSSDFSSSGINQVIESTGEIRVDRDLIESALESFDREVSDIRERQEALFHTLEDLLPQIVAAMVEKGLVMRSRSVIFHVLQQLSEPERIHVFDVFTRRDDLRRHGRPTDTSLALWLAEQLSFMLEDARELLRDYFDDLLACVRDMEVARCKVFQTLGISASEEHPDLAWIKDVKIVHPSMPTFAWHAPVVLLYLVKISWLRKFVLRSGERLVSEQVASYCDRLGVIVQRAVKDWLSDVRWQLDQELAERSDNWAISSEIVRRLRETWRKHSSTPKSAGKVHTFSNMIVASAGD